MKIYEGNRNLFEIVSNEDKKLQAFILKIY